MNLVSVPDKIPVEPTRDRFDWFVAACTLILTVVGVVGTCVALKTLKAINRQAHYMLVHARHLNKLAKAARDDADAATKNAEFSKVNAEATETSVRALEKQSALMDGQLKEMQEAGKRTDRHLGLTQRPWISPIVRLISPLTVDENGVHITLRIERVNVGNSPAVGIWVNPSLYLQHPSKPTVTDERKRICQEIIAGSSDWGEMLFPRANPPHIQDYTINATAEDVNKSLIADRMYSPEIIICVAYRSTIDETARHYTGAIYHLSRFDPEHPNTMFAFYHQQTVPLEHLRLYSGVFGPTAQ